ncbi:MAG: hypothetical protein A4S09_03925 [Proteobacteria bacterium SG_bin7]|nr:MAG: hypothetical protein A4S09_03925 [Proteobacteria bacterium SG_bin7]
MKFLKILIIILTAFLGLHLTHAAGDLGGGGSSKLDLTPEQKITLLSQSSQQAALVTWANQLDKEAKAEVYKKVFESHILPQLINK